MESYREIEKGLLGRKITARLQFLDEGLNVLLTGGEKSHIGAVSGRVPGQEPVDIELPGHREGNLAGGTMGRRTIPDMGNACMGGMRHSL